MKNSFLPVILGAKINTPFLRFFPKNMHITDKYLALIKKIAKVKTSLKSDFILTSEEKNKWDSLKIPPSIFIACSSRSKVKRYSYECLKKVVGDLRGKYSLVVLGMEKERQFYGDILSLGGVVDLLGQTRMIDVFYLLKNYARLIIGVDSSITHLGSYLNIPIISFFGPTHPGRSYPKSDNSLILTNEEARCAPCEKAACEFDYECMNIEPQRVVEAVRQILNK